MRTLVGYWLLPVLCAFSLLASVPKTAVAHAIDHREYSASARVVEVVYADGRPVDFEEFEVTGPGDRSPFMVGRTDRLGRVVFVPDRDGEWSVKVWSEDGHGLTTTVMVEQGPDSGAEDAQQHESTSGNRTRRLIGLAIGLGVISALGASLFLKAKGKQP
jgi:hypothetical protein